jgi:hypothetical protein
MAGLSDDKLTPQPSRLCNSIRGGREGRKRYGSPRRTSLGVWRSGLQRPEPRCHTHSAQRNGTRCAYRLPRVCQFAADSAVSRREYLRRDYRSAAGVHSAGEQRAFADVTSRRLSSSSCHFRGSLGTLSVKTILNRRRTTLSSVSRSRAFVRAHGARPGSPSAHYDTPYREDSSDRLHLPAVRKERNSTRREA